MTITISTAKLIGMLADALQTAETDPDEFSVGVHIATHRGGFGDEPGSVDLIAVTSTDRFVVGHTFDVVDGQITPSVWPVESAKTVQLICKGLLQSRGKEHPSARRRNLKLGEVIMADRCTTCGEADEEEPKPEPKLLEEAL